jgi:hypothetical protein
MEVLVPIKEVKEITNKNKIIIDSKEYNYKIYKIDNNIEYINKENTQKLYLQILNLDETYLINGYEVNIKFLKEKRKIIDYLKNKEE